MKQKTVAEFLFETLGQIARRMVPQTVKRERKAWPTMVMSPMLEIIRWNAMIDNKNRARQQKLFNRRVKHRHGKLSGKSVRRNSLLGVVCD